MIPRIENGKQPYEPLNAMHLGFVLPPSTPYGNLSLKLFRIIQRLDHVNLRISDLDEWYEKRNLGLETGELTLSNLDPTDDLCLGDEITFWLKRTVDELIALLYIKNYWALNNMTYPSQLKIDCVETLLKDKEGKFLKDRLARHVSFLENLNAISNAQKHSFIGTDLTVTSGSEICFFALELPRNDSMKQPKFIWIRAKDLILDFNFFYKRAIQELKEWQAFP